MVARLRDSSCVTCSRYQPALEGEVREPSRLLICAAFPAGIPAEIADGRDPHTSPYPGDHGLTYEPKDA